MKLDELVERALRLARTRHRTVLGIAGPPGAGKTTLSAALVSRINQVERARETTTPTPYAVHVPLDGFHLADVELRRLGASGRKGAPDTFDSAGYVALLRRLRSAQEEVTYAPTFDRDLEQPVAGSIPVHRQTRLVVTEGNYLLLDTGSWKHVRPLLDDAWFCQLDDDSRRQRLVERHVRFGKSPERAGQWVDVVDEANARLVAGTRARADLALTVDDAIA